MSASLMAHCLSAHIDGSMSGVAERAAKYFEKAFRRGGVIARMRLAAMSRITSAEALAVPDAPELIARLDLALERLQEDLGGATSEPVAQPSAAGAEQDLMTIRRQIAVFLELLSQRRLLAGEFAETTRRVTATAAHTLNCARVSVWMLTQRQSAIECMDLYSRDEQSHSCGQVLTANDYPAYFEALRRERTIAAHDAHGDPRTSCFSASYLTPLGIGALLDVPIWLGGETVGVICHEHVGGTRTWTTDEESFAYLMAHFAGIGLAGPRVARPMPRPADSR